MEGLKASLAERLPGYMVPTTLTVLDRLPLNASGKLDRRSLPRPERVQGRGGGGGLLKGEVEEALGSVWREVLGVERVEREENFFELGGDSS